MYSKIVLCLSENEDDVPDKQIGMLQERHHAEIARISACEAVEYISDCDTQVLFISDDEELLAIAKDKGIATNEPKKMKESYAKAMEMLKAMGITNR